MLQVYVLEDRLLLELPPGLTEQTLRLLDKFLISEKAYFEAADESYCVLSVEGRDAAALLSRLSGRNLDLAPYGHVEVSIAGAPVRVIRRSETGGPGSQCWTMPFHGAALWRALVESGARPVGTEALNVLRIEAGIPWYGHDVDETVILPETRLEHLVSYNKGCYIGQEVVARVKYRGHVNRALTGLVLDGDRVPAVRREGARRRQGDRPDHLGGAVHRARTTHRARLCPPRALRSRDGRQRSGRGCVDSGARRPVAVRQPVTSPRSHEPSRRRDQPLPPPACP